MALHVATGAAAGAASGSRLAALLLGPVLHLAGDRLPHEDIRSRRFEIGSVWGAQTRFACESEYRSVWLNARSSLRTPHGATLNTVRARASCQDGQPLSFSASSVWGRRHSVPPANRDDPAV
jgi:hypothetical protein